MYSCSDNECNTVREPVCGRGGPVTAASVTGTGPGAACEPEAEESPPTAAAPKLGCRITVRTGGKFSHRTRSGNISLKVC
jgi:hypothetical protein